MVPASIPFVQTPVTQVVPDGHANAAPHPPQLFLSVVVLTQALPQSVGYATLSHSSPQTGAAPVHVAVPFVGAAHGAQLVPHDVIEVDLSLTHVPEQSCVPAEHVQAELTHTFPPVQARDAAAVLHAPQLAALVRVSTSQPFDSTPSQFPYPVAHAWMMQLEFVQPAVAWATVHTLPQPLQLLGSLVV